MNEERKEQKLVIKLSLSLLYFIVIGILIITSYSLYQKNNKIESFHKVKNTSDYSKITISQMSDKIAYYKEKNIGIHYVMEYENTGKWHTYLIAINENDISKYQNIIDYTYKKTINVPETITVYGYPVLINDDLKNIAIKHINDFIPESNEVVINESNFNDYLTNTYLDTTKERNTSFDFTLFLLLLLTIFMIFLMIYTLGNNSKLVKSIDHFIERKQRKIKRIKKKLRKR